MAVNVVSGADDDDDALLGGIVAGGGWVTAPAFGLAPGAAATFLLLAGSSFLVFLASLPS